MKIRKLLWCFWLVSSSLFGDDTVYSFGIVPQETPTHLATMWVPLIQDISNRTGIKLKFDTATSISNFEQGLGLGQYDFAFINPYNYIVYDRIYQVLARNDKNLHGIIVVRCDSDINKISDLNNKEMAFPSPNSFGATLLIKQFLLKNHITVTPVYVNTHESVYISVLKEYFPGGGGVIRTFNNLPDSARNQLCIIYSTPEFVSHPFVGKRTIPLNVIKKVTDALLTTDNEILKKANLSILIPTTDKEYDQIRKLMESK